MRVRDKVVYIFASELFSRSLSALDEQISSIFVGFGYWNFGKDAIYYLKLVKTEILFGIDSNVFFFRSLPKSWWIKTIGIVSYSWKQRMEAINQEKRLYVFVFYELHIKNPVLHCSLFLPTAIVFLNFVNGFSCFELQNIERSLRK